MIVLGLTGLFLVILLMGFFSFFVARRFCRVIVYRNPQSVTTIRAQTQLQQYYIENSAAGRARGLDCTLLNNLPILQFSPAAPVIKFIHGDDVDGLDVNKAAHEANVCVNARECAVCLNEFAEGDMLRLLPQCHHFFHQACVDMWLFSHTTCPLCRLSLLNPKIEEDDKADYGGTSSTSSVTSCDTGYGADTTNTPNESSCAIQIEGP